MRSWLSLVLVLLCATTGIAQSILQRKTIDEENNVFSYVDDLGKEVIAADTFFAMPALRFKDVAAFITPQQAVYRFRNGSTREGIYFFDNWYDCENNGSIRFRDSLGNVGIYSGTGQILVPAQFNDLLPLVNGFTFGLKGAIKTCFEEDCEHFYWKGGKTVLLDTLGQELAELDSTIAFWDLDLSAATSAKSATNVEGVTLSTTSGMLFIPFSHALLRNRFHAGFETVKSSLAATIVVDGKQQKTLTRAQFWKKYGKDLKRFYDSCGKQAEFYTANTYDLPSIPQWSLWQNNCGDISPDFKVFKIYSPVANKKFEHITVIQKGDTFWLVEVTLNSAP